MSETGSDDLRLQGDACSPFASRTVTRHVLRGLLGIACIVAAISIAALSSAGAVVFAIAGVAVLRGCPMCWFVGLLETVGRRTGGTDQRDPAATNRRTT